MGVLIVPLVFVTSFHVIALLGAWFVRINTVGLIAWAMMYILTGLGITVGYHRMWSHQAYKGVTAWKLWWAFWGAGALQGSILWWCKLHRLHHSFPESESDPYSASKGFMHSHCLWMFQKVDRTEDLKRIKVADLKQDPIVFVQHKIYVWLGLVAAFIPPLVLFWRDPLQAIIYGGFWARLFTWHSTWCVNSLAHWLGENDYSYDTSAKDHFITALVTFGEGNHGFHHAFPYSYKNGLNWYHYDPTKIIIELASLFELAYDLKHPSDDEISMSKYQTLEHKLELMKDTIAWPDKSIEKVLVPLGKYLGAKKNGKLWLAVEGRVVDVTEFHKEHPGGDNVLKAMASADPEIIEKQMSWRHQHTLNARNKINRLTIGRLED